MQNAAISDLKNRLSHFLRLVGKGEVITVLDRGRPVALLTPLRSQDSKLAELVAQGHARPPIEELPADFLRRKLPVAKGSVVESLGRDRDDRF